MIKATICLCLIAIVVSSRAYEAAEIRHIEADGSHLIDTSLYNYALTSPKLETNGWKTVSVNGNTVVFQSSTCQVVTKQLNALTAQEASEIKLVKSQLESLESNYQVQNTFGSYSISRQTLAGQSMMRNSMSKNINTSNLQMNGFSATRQNENNFSISKPNMSNNLARVYLMNSVVAYVYLDGQVQMKPLNCLSQVELQYVQSLKAEVAAAQQQLEINMQNMQNNLQQNMQNMQANIQQNMQNMQQSMGNMFSNGFPFNNNQGNRYFQQPQYGNGQMTNSYAANYMNPGAYSMNQVNGYQGPSAFAGAGSMANFGNNWPFGPRNNPFGPGFPFNG